MKRTNYCQSLMSYMFVFGLLFLTAAVSAQNSTDAPAASGPMVTGKVSADKIRFVAPSGVVRIRAEILSESGDSLVDVSSKGNIFDWSLVAGDGQRLGDGNFVCVITVKSLDGKMSQRIGTVSIKSGKASLQAGSAKLTENQQAVIGPVEDNSALTVLFEEGAAATVATHNGTEGQLTSTKGPLTFRTGDIFTGSDKERMRLTEDGKLGVGTDAPRAEVDVKGTVRATEGFQFNDGTKLDAQNGKLRLTNGAGETVPEALGFGTQNRITKWLSTGPGGSGAGELVDSNAIEVGGKFGINTATPTSTLTVAGVMESTTGGVKFPDGTVQTTAASAPGAGAILNQTTLQTGANFNIDGTGYVGTRFGVGTTTPSLYKLDVVHTGASGIRSQSSAGFSLIDIDAFNGDAALRLAHGGVTQWNMRNRPGDDYLEFFELGGGGSRMVIQDGTGNVGIGETTNPTYRLDVLHGGATGIRNRSSSSFSVMDIDGASGDAALRFAHAGVNQWNIRNRPADDYLEIFELGGGGSRVVVQDGTGNVGIGETVNPSYKLDVLHGGATGIRSRSDSTFSLIDIDAANGDAALRFARAGVNQWNTRNRPADDYYEIFELGGGGSRFVIQDGTGNVGIGETTNPTYKLDVLHGGATGIRSRSSGTFSVIDIDGANGDAALRFAKAGVNQWNIRNNPATDDLQIFELGGGGERMRIENGTGKVVIGGDLDVGGNVSKGGGSFKIDHPLDPENKYLYHSFVESPDMMNIYNGNLTTDANGEATVTMPNWFESLNRDFRYQLTVMGQFAQAIVTEKMKSNSFKIKTSLPNVEVSWQVTGVRHDAYAEKNRIQVEVVKPGKERGTYLYPEVFGQPVEKGLAYSRNAEERRREDAVAGPQSTDDTPIISGVRPPAHAVTEMQSTDEKAVVVSRPAATKTVVGPQSTDAIPQVEAAPKTPVRGAQSTDPVGAKRRGQPQQQ